MPAPNLARAAFSQGSQIIRVRRSTGAYIDGRWTVHGDHDEMIRMAVRPNADSPQASAISRRILGAEGARTEDTITVLVMPSTPLRHEQSQEGGGASPDRILFRNWWWKVVGETEWDQCVFRRYFAVREQKWSGS
jgi:hypothetical protein